MQRVPRDGAYAVNLTCTLAQWRIQEFKNWGRGPGAVLFCLYKFVLMPLHTYPMLFLVKVENKVHIVNIAC